MESDEKQAWVKDLLRRMDSLELRVQKELTYLYESKRLEESRYVKKCSNELAAMKSQNELLKNELKAHVKVKKLRDFLAKDPHLGALEK